MLDHFKGIGARVGMASGATAALTMVAFMLGQAAHAVDPLPGEDPAFDAIQSMGDKITLYGGAIVALVVIAAGIFLGLKYLKKGLSKA